MPENETGRKGLNNHAVQTRATSDLGRQIDHCLPQTQCTLCGYPRCRDYADAIARGDADINRCPPGGAVTIQALARLLQRSPRPLNPENGIHEPRQLARIRERDCIGCRLCIKACPVGCIVGAAKVMHTVIAGQCTGCKLCIPVCPTDCIELVPAPEPQAPKSRWPGFALEQVDRARRDTGQTLSRAAARDRRQRQRRLPLDRARLRREIRAAIERKRQHRDGLS